MDGNTNFYKDPVIIGIGTATLIRIHNIPQQLYDNYYESQIRLSELSNPILHVDNQNRFPLQTTYASGTIPAALSVYANWMEAQHVHPTFITSIEDDSPLLQLCLSEKGINTFLPSSQDEKLKSKTENSLNVLEDEEMIISSYTKNRPLGKSAINQYLLASPIEVGHSLLHIDLSELEASIPASQAVRAEDGRVYLSVGKNDLDCFLSVERELALTTDIVQIPRSVAEKSLYQNPHPALPDSPASLSLQKLADMMQARTKIQVVIVTDGERGSAFRANGKLGYQYGYFPHYQDFPYDPLHVDISSAEGIFAGAVGCSLFKGHDLREAVQIASVASAAALQFSGRSVISYTNTYMRAFPHAREHSYPPLR